MYLTSNQDLVQTLTSYYDQPCVQGIFKRYGVSWQQANQLTAGEREDVCRKTAREIRAAGSNSIATLFRREPVAYSEVVYDVACKMKVERRDVDREDYLELERRIFISLIEKHIEGLSPEEKQDFFVQVFRDKLPSDSFNALLKGDVAFTAAMMVAVQVIGRAALPALLARVITWYVSGLTLTRGLTFVSGVLVPQLVGAGASLAAGRAAGLLIPGLNALMAGWLVADLAGPAYRKTMPTVFEISTLHILDSVQQDALPAELVTRKLTS